MPCKCRVTAIKLSQGEHAGLPLQSMNTWRFVGHTCVSALNLMAVNLRLFNFSNTLQGLFINSAAKMKLPGGL